MLLIASLMTMALQSCVSLKPHERIYVNDSEMLFGAETGVSYRNYVYKIREGSTPAGAGKASGGCGCN